MKTSKTTASEQLSRRDFLKRIGLGSLSLMAMAAFGTTLFSSCEKDDDDDKDDLAEFEEELRKLEEKNKKDNKS